MQDVQSLIPVGAQINEMLAWLSSNAGALSLDTLGQTFVVALTYAIAAVGAARLRPLAAALPVATWLQPFAPVFSRILSPLTLPLLWLTLTWISVGAARGLSLPAGVLNLAATLLTAWVVIRLFASFVTNVALSRLLAGAIWTIAALNSLGLLAPTLEMLDSVAVAAGDLKFSLLTLLKAFVWLAGGIWVATLLNRLVEHRVSGVSALTPSMQVLIVKMAKIALVGFAIAVAMAAVGIDLTALTLLTGALGLGVGFGLQKAVANFVSGLSMLLDRSIRPGDVISVGETFGWVNSMGGRYVSVRTRDGLEYLIPNEDLITKQVVNWSMSDDRVRIRAPIGVSYKSDVHRARQICVDAAREIPRVIADPEPLCHLVAFGDSAVELELRFWIRDPRNGIVNVKSDVLLRIWDRFKAEGIEIPFPQRDLHVKGPLHVSLEEGATPHRARG